MNKLRILTLMIVLLFAAIVLAEESRTNVSTREMLEASGNFDNNEIETIIRLLDEKTNIDDTIASDNRGYIDSDNWQVVRITGVASANHPNWEGITKYDTSTSIDHGGNWLLVRTEENALNPLNGFVDAKLALDTGTQQQMGLYFLATEFTR